MNHLGGQEFTSPEEGGGGRGEERGRKKSGELVDQTAYERRATRADDSLQIRAISWTLNPDLK